MNALGKFTVLLTDWHKHGYRRIGELYEEAGIAPASIRKAL